MNKSWALLAVLTGILAAFSCGCGSETEKFSAKIKAKLNPDTLQTWAMNLIAKMKTTNQDSIVIKQTEVPDWVGSIYKTEGDPGIVSIEHKDLDNTNAFVQILYGGGFGHWGLAIGYPSLILTNHDDVHINFWKPGIYFWNSP